MSRGRSSSAAGPIARIGAVARADFLIRFRRISTLVLFLFISFSAYLWVPDPATGRALLQVGEHRAVYNSAAIAVATASLGTILVGLLGFYVVSNAVALDVRSRAGFVIASTRMRSSEYLLGKLLGNVVFLTAFMAGYMVVSMAMVLVRGEAGLEPLVFAWHYLLLAPPTILFVSTIAIVFESIPLLSGRLGDVAWFFLWMAGMAVPAVVLEAEHPPAIVRYFDFSGLGFLMSRIKEDFGTTAVAIGASAFDASKNPIVVQPLSLSPDWIAPRLGACLLPLLLLPIALLFFHRFDPARVRQKTRVTHAGWLGEIQRLLKPLTRPLGALRLRSKRGSTSLWNAAWEDAFVTLTAAPLLAVTIPAFAVISLVLPMGMVRRGVLPALFLVLAVLIADVPSRERRAGLLPMAFAAPRLKSGFLRWKLATSILVSLPFVTAPFVRLVAADPAPAMSGASLLTGTLFTCSAAVALGLASSSPKTFLALFLVFWYLVINDGGGTPQLDFAGFYGTATPAVMAGYLALGALLLAAAAAVHSARLAREGY